MKAKDIIVSEDRFRKDLGDLEALKNSIKLVGQLQPIVVDKKNNLIVGLRRLIVCKELGIDPIVRVIDCDNPMQAEIHDNAFSKPFTPREAFEICQHLNKTQSKKPGPKDDNSITQRNGIRPIDQASFITQIGTTKLSEINTIYKSIHTDIQKKVDEGKMSVKKASESIKQLYKLGADPNNETKDKQRLNLKPVQYEKGMFHLPRLYDPNYKHDHIIQPGANFPTLLTRNGFFHPAKAGSEPVEFSTREYARVQDIPDDFELVGSESARRKQIGNAVSPKMADHVIRKYLDGNLKGKTCGDLFAGCGGFSLGAEMNGIVSKWAVEKDIFAAHSYMLNFPDSIVYYETIAKINPNELEKVDIIIGGPPCQGFSKVGYQYKNDPRNKLYKEFLRFVEALKPGEFIMENVPEIAKIKDEIIKDFEEIDYVVRTELVKGEDIEMKQKRKRFFFIGTLRPEAMIQELPKAA